MKEYTNYVDWAKDANTLGWVHIFDDLIVVDDPDSGECLGEWDDESYTGWLNVL